MKEIGLLLLFMVTAAKGQVKCGDYVTGQNGTITPDSNATLKTDCIITIGRINTYGTQTFLILRNLNLAENDTLVIYDGAETLNKSIVTYKSSNSVTLQVLIGFETNTTIVFIPNQKPTGSEWSISYNFDDCHVPLENVYALKVDGPLYFPKAGNLSCKYVVANKLPQDQRPVASILRFTIQAKSSLLLSSGTQNKTYTSSDALDDFFADTDLEIIVTISDTNVTQSFSLLVESVVKDCSGIVPSNKTVIHTFPDQPVSYACRWQVQVNSSTLLATLKSLVIVASGDRLDFTDSSSTHGKIVASVTNSVTDYLVVASKNVLTINLRLTGWQGPRSINLSFSENVQGARLENEGILEANGSKSDSAFYQLTSTSVIQVEVKNNLTGNMIATFYTGLQKSDPPLLVLNATSQDLKRVIGDSNMLVVLSGLVPSDRFDAKFSSIPADCDKLATEPNGQLTYTQNTNQTCTWTIAPQGMFVVDVEVLTLNKDESVTFYSLPNNTVIAKVSGPTTAESFPQMYAERMGVVIKVVQSDMAPKVSIRYQVSPSCGGKLDQVTRIMTPNYPNQYPLNAKCVWTTGSNMPSTPSFVYIDFQSFALAQTHSLSVVSVVNTTSSVVLASYGGIGNLPVDLIVPWDNKTVMTVQFQSQATSSAEAPIDKAVESGADLTARILSCGGNVTKMNGSFQSPKLDPKSSVFCVWIIDVKNYIVNETSVVNFTISASETALNKWIYIYDGDSLSSSKLLPVNSSKPYLSLKDRLIVIFNYTSSSGKWNDDGFSLTFQNYNCTLKCENKLCLHPDWLCNGHNDCGDNSDELDCGNGTTTTSSPLTTTAPQAADYSGWVKSGWVPACLFIGMLLGALLLFAAPKIIRRLRGRDGNYSRMSDDQAVVT